MTRTTETALAVNDDACLVTSSDVTSSDVTSEPVAAPAIEPEPTTVAIKGFDKDFKCRQFQYEIGKTYDLSGPLVICGNGFHACDENPLDVWKFYPVIDDDGNFNRYGLTTHHGKIQREKDESHSKIASAKITIDAELLLPDFIKRAVSWMMTAATSAPAVATLPTVDVDNGNHAKQASSGNYANQASSGNCAKQASSGNDAKQASSGNHAKQASSGNRAQQASSGNCAQHIAIGKNSVIASSGRGAAAKGAVGTWISLAEFDPDGKCLGFASGCIGEDGLEPDTYYRAKNRKLVRVI